MWTCKSWSNMYIPAVLQRRKLCEEVSFSGAVVLTHKTRWALTLRFTADGGQTVIIKTMTISIVYNPSENLSLSPVNHSCDHQALGCSALKDTQHPHFSEGTSLLKGFLCVLSWFCNSDPSVYYTWCVIMCHRLRMCSDFHTDPGEVDLTGYFDCFKGILPQKLNCQFTLHYVIPL